MAQKQTGEFVNARGQKLVTVAFLPPAPQPTVASFLYHHGMGEHVGRYDARFAALAEKGIATFSFDAAGHGNSEPKEDSERALILKFEHTVGGGGARRGGRGDASAPSP